MKRFLILFIALASLLALPALAEELPQDVPAESAPPDVLYTTYELDPVAGASPSDGAGKPVQLPDFLQSFFGPYTPKTYTVTEHLSDGTVITSQQYVPGVAGMDFEWLAAAALFILVIFCVFKLIGGLVKL